MRVALLELRGFVYEMISQQRNWCTRTNLKGQQQFFCEKWVREENIKQELLERQKRGKEYNDEERQELHVTIQYVNLI